MKQTKELFDKKVSRKEFLQILGVAVLTVFGVTNFLSLLRSHLANQPASSPTVAKETRSGFGSSKFGA